MTKYGSYPMKGKKIIFFITGLLLVGVLIALSIIFYLQSAKLTKELEASTETTITSPIATTKLLTTTEPTTTTNLSTTTEPTTTTKLSASTTIIAKTTTTTTISTTTTTKKGKDGWVRWDNGEIMFYKDNQFLTGMQKIGKTTALPDYE